MVIFFNYIFKLKFNFCLLLLFLNKTKKLRKLKKNHKELRLKYHRVKDLNINLQIELDDNKKTTTPTTIIEQEETVEDVSKFKNTFFI